VARVIAVPGHTLDHLAFLFDEARVAFVGDTMFAMGCGRLFEGTAEQMFGSLARLSALPADTALYAAHEYTLSNARFAEHSEPDNQAILERHERVRQLREEGRITLPTTVAQERATNPFVRAADAQQLATLRAEKDSFR
jgi:hydroxyacylglutathione hydrolase